MSQQQGMGGEFGPGAQHLQRSGLRSVSVDEIVQEDVVTAEPDTPLETIVSKMREEDVGSVVIHDDNKPVSILTDRKIALSLDETSDFSELTAEDVMDTDLVTGTSELSVFEALQKLNEENVRRLPIVDDNGELKGIITLDDMLVLLGSEMQKATDIIRAQSPRL